MISNSSRLPQGDLSGTAVVKQVPQLDVAIDLSASIVQVTFESESIECR